MERDYSILNVADKELKQKWLDVNGIIDRLGYPIEPGISSLVVALNFRGYETTASCEGHILSEWKRRVKDKVDSGEYKLFQENEHELIYKERLLNFPPWSWIKINKRFDESPWVDIEKDNKIDKLKEILEKHNQLESIRGGFKNYSRRSKRTRLYCLPQYYLQEMQGDIPKLAYDIITSS